MTKLLPTLLPILSLIGVALSTTIQAAISHHALLASVVAAFVGVVNHWLPSPAAS